MMSARLWALSAIVATVIFNASMSYFFYVPMLTREHGCTLYNRNHITSQTLSSNGRPGAEAETWSNNLLHEDGVKHESTIHEDDIKHESTLHEDGVKHESTPRTTILPTTNPTKLQTTPSKKFGLCLTGQYARLELASKIENFIKPLLAGYYDEIDVVLLLSTGSATFVNSKFRGSGRSPYRDSTQVKRELSKVASKIRFVDYNQPPNPRVLPEYLNSLDKSGDMGSPAAQEERAKGHLRQWYGYVKCYHAFLELEVENGAKYQAVGRLREDGYIAEPIDVDAIVAELQKPRKLLSIRCENWRGINDKIGIVRRELAEQYFMTPITEYYLYPDKTLSTTPDLKNPERYLKFSYLRNGFIHKKLTSDVLTVLAHRWNSDGGSCLKTVASTHFDCHSHGDNQLREKLLEMRCEE